MATVAMQRKGEQMNDFARKVIEQMNKYGFTAPDMTVTEFVEDILPPAQPEQYLDSIVSEIKKTISEIKESGRYHCIDIRTNGEMMCYGLQLALEIIEEKRNGQSDKQTGGD